MKFKELNFMTFIWQTGIGIGNIILSSIIITLLYALFFVLFYVVVKRKYAFILLGFSFACTIVGFLFTLTAVVAISVAMLASLVTICVFTNIGDARKFLSNPFKRTNAKPINFGVEKIFDQGELLDTVTKAIKNLSATRTGAIITFEKSTSLKDIIKNGVPVNAPVSEELLTTIFFPGTRLHDGAVIIHGDQIVAASVFFTPTTKPFAGKYGSRHRAAIGVSEVSDAITVVVSEETGRISFAVNGELEIVSPDKFRRVLENYIGYKEE